MKEIPKALFALMAMATPVFAVATAMKESLSAPPDGYRSDDEINAHLVEFAWPEGDKGTSSIFEISFEGDTIMPLITLALRG